MVSSKDRESHEGEKIANVRKSHHRKYEKLPLTSPILHGRKFPLEVEKRGRIRRRRRRRRDDDDIELPRDGRLNARYGLSYDSLIDKKLFPAAMSYIILETETDNEIPPLTVGVWNAINHDKKKRNARSFLFVKLAKAAGVLRATVSRFRKSHPFAVHPAESEWLRHPTMRIDELVN